MNTIYKDINKPTIAFVIVQNEGFHKRYFNGSTNPNIEISHHHEGAKHFDTYEQAEKELKFLELEKFNPPFIVEEHEWL